ncbi:hypothetical protein HY419_00305 [candidate division WWE3 bacterium]|nr:hypothetical protein [candidate division WWE3 bacterium]
MRKFLFASTTCLLILAVYFQRSSRAVTDTNPPVSSITLLPSSPDGLNGWYITPIDFTITGDDLESGIKSINYNLDSTGLQTKTFNDTLNLVSNPSFESPGTPLDSWDKTNDDTQAIFTQDSQAAPSLGTYSAKVDATQGSAWHGFNNKNFYVVASPYQNMTSSVWVMASNVALSAYYKIYIVYDGGDGQNAYQLEATSPVVTGTFAWQKITLNFVVNHPNALGVYIDLGLDGTGAAWFDGVSITSSITQPSTNFAVSANGNHSLEYYSIDNANNEETPHKIQTFKIDTKVPSKWTNFTLTRQGNDHTFNVSVKVTDTTSGVDVSTAEFQYSVDEGVTWGYYSNLLNCGSSFVQGWKQASSNPNSDGSTTVTLSTGAINFCNSNWTDTKMIRFRLADMAGNQGESGDFTINGAWIELEYGDVFSNSSIAMKSNSKVRYLAGSASTVANITSTANWYLTDYEPLPFMTFDDWYARYPSTTPLPNGKLPTTSGKYYVNTDFTVASNTIPSGFSTIANLSAVVYINGDLNVNKDYNVHTASALIFIVKGDITVANNVSTVDSFYITDGTFDVGASTTQLTVDGGVHADTFNLKRSLTGSQNSTKPAVIFKYRGKYPAVGKKQLSSESKILWLGDN